MPLTEEDRAEVRKEVRKELGADAKGAWKSFVYSLLFFGGIALLGSLPRCAG